MEKDLDNIRRGYEVTLSVTVDGHAAENQASFYVLGERSLCYSILCNLVKNAMEASPQGETVWIELQEGEQGYAGIAIGNKGAIPDNIQDKFGRKYATAKKSYGTGLGVYSARLIAETMDGYLTWTTSREQGTTVTVALPRDRDSSLLSPGAGS